LKALTFSGFGLVALGLGWWLIAHRPQAVASPKPNTRSDSVSAAELASLKQQVNALQAQTLVLQARPTQSAAVVAVPSAAAAPPTEEERQRMNEVAYAEAKHRYEQQFATDSGSSDWSRTTEAGIRTTLGQLTPDLAKQVTAVECRARVCRVQTEHASLGESMAFMDEIEKRPGFQGNRFVRIRTKPDTQLYEYFVEPRVELSEQR
jgi:hypothetical protein